MESKTIACCCKCRKPIISGEDFVRFKIPGKAVYVFFHRRFRIGDCWELHLQAK